MGRPKRQTKAPAQFEAQGFHIRRWSLQDKRQLLSSLKRHGKDAMDKIAKDLALRKSRKEVENYLQVMKVRASRFIPGLDHNLEAPIETWLCLSEELVRDHEDYSDILAKIFSILGSLEPHLPCKTNQQVNYTAIYRYLAAVMKGDTDSLPPLKDLNAAIILDLIQSMADTLESVDLTLQRQLVLAKHRLLKSKISLSQTAQQRYENTRKALQNEIEIGTMLPETTAVLYPHETAATDESELNTSQSTDSSHPPEEYSRPNTSEGQLDGPTSGMIETSVNPPVVQSTLALPINTPRPVTQTDSSHPSGESSASTTSEGQSVVPTTSGMIGTSVNPPVVASTQVLGTNTPKPVTQNISQAVKQPSASTAPPETRAPPGLAPAPSSGQKQVMIRLPGGMKLPPGQYQFTPDQLQALLKSQNITLPKVFSVKTAPAAAAGRPSPSTSAGSTDVTPPPQPSSSQSTETPMDVDIPTGQSSSSNTSSTLPRTTNTQTLNASQTQIDSDNAPGSGQPQQTGSSATCPPLHTSLPAVSTLGGKSDGIVELDKVVEAPTLASPGTTSGPPKSNLPKRTTMYSLNPFCIPVRYLNPMPKNR